MKKKTGCTVHFVNDKLDSGKKSLIPNNGNGNYNTIPTFYEAVSFRLKIIKKTYR